VLGRALAEAQRAGVPRDELFVVSKALPQHAGTAAVQTACERSLRRLGLDRIDLYLLHWRGATPLAHTVAGMQALQRRGLIRHWGVSNFDVDDLDELAAVPGGTACAANQVYYSASQRGIEFALLPRQQAQGLPLMAYSPVDQGALARHAALQPLAARLGVTPAQVVLAWVLRGPGVMAIPKAASRAHLLQNLAAAALQLGAGELAEIDRIFPPPRRKQPLATT
jgi:diketogulonate reductase-like aldo/keto reductase